MLETLATTSEQIENAEPVSAHPDKLREQLAENKVCLVGYCDVILVGIKLVRRFYINTKIDSLFQFKI